MAKNLKTLLRNVFNLEVQENTMLLGIAYDSRRVLSGECFCAYQGYSADGKQFIEEAIEKGANAILIENDFSSPTPDWHTHNGKRIPLYKLADLPEKLGQLAAWFYGYPSLNMKVIGVTGTNGKTSYSYLLATALSYLGVKTAFIGSLGYGYLGALKPSVNTTLNAVENQKLLAEFRDKGTEYIVMEVSSHALDQGRVNGIHFALTTFTNLTQDHLDYHETLEEYANAKEKLFSRSTPAIINYDDSLGRKLIARLDDCIAYSRYYQPIPTKYLCAAESQCNADGLNVNFMSSFGEGKFSSPLVGAFNVSNLLAVLASLLRLNFNFKAAEQVISKLTVVPGRMESFGGNGKPMVYVDYAHTPDALKQALSTLKAFCKGKLFCVFGCGGDRDRNKRGKMAAVVESLADYVIVTQDNPRTEDPDAIFSDLKQGFIGSNYAVELDRATAIKTVLAEAAENDLVLIAGKGREPFQEVGYEKHPYSDIETVIACLEEAACYTH